MKRFAIVFILFGVVGCPAKQTTPILTNVEQTVEEVVEQVAPKRGRAVRPGEWVHATGLMASIPVDWSAWEGLPGDIRVLQRVSHH